MTPERHARIRAVFLKAVSSPAEKLAACLDQECGPDSDLRNEVEILLAQCTNGGALKEAAAVAGEFPSKPIHDPLKVAPSAFSAAMRDAPAPISAAEFKAGHMIAGRYRLQCKLGEGGMGVVYRAEDVVLDSTVAIKFLAGKASSNSSLVERFRSEVRMAHRVSHRNVCRVFDIGEADGQTFLTMGFCDGEDLGRFIRRVGAIPSAKGVDIARQICGGLAAAHGAGVLHRDLKPSNILLDAKGTVLITDFGIAAAVDAAGFRDVAGTPGYMAPEQIIGVGVDERSDIYSLGLVLYEIFSGRPAFQEDSVVAYLERQIKSEPTPISELVPDIDRDLEALICKCISKDRGERPPSALAVASALPGADALAIAIEANQTASPNLVANSTQLAKRLKRPGVWAAVAIASCLLLPFIRGWSGYPWDAGDSHPPAVLLNFARSAMRELRPALSNAHSAYGYCDRNRARFLLERFAGALPSGQAIGPRRGLFFWYRESVAPLVPTSIETLIFESGITTSIDPPMRDADQSLVLLDDRGRLVGFVTVASEQETTSTNATEFAALARWNEVDSRPAEVSWNDRTANKRCESWNGTFDDSSPGRLVHCALDDSLSVFFAMEPEPSAPAPVSSFTAQFRTIFVRDSMRLFYIVAMIASLPWALRNLRLSRCDIQGASRLFMFFICAALAAWLIRAARSDPIQLEIGVIFVTLVRALGLAAMAVVFYLALEPATRKYWPHLLITWTRLLQSHSASTALWHHVLVGVAVGSVLAILSATNYAVNRSLWGLPTEPLFVQQVGQRILGMGSMLAGVCGSMLSAVGQGLLIIFLLTAARWLTGRGPLAAAITGTILLGLILPRGPRLDPVTVTTGIVGIGLILWAVIQFGLISLVLLIFVNEVLNLTPMTFRSTHWFFPMSATALVTIAATVAYAYTKAQSGVRSEADQPR